MYLSHPNVDAIASALAAAPEGHVSLIFLAGTSASDLPAIQAALAATGRPFAGGLFPGLIVGGCHHESGAVVLSLPASESPYLIADLDRHASDLGTISRQRADPDRRTAWVMVDGLSGSIGRFLQALFDRFGGDTQFLGGGAGLASLEPSTCLFSRHGVHRDAALVTFLDLDATLAAGHGWQPFHGPLVADRTDGNRILSLNWECPFEVYALGINSDLGQAITPETFSEVAKGYPFGMSRFGSEPIVRDPIATTPEGALVCVGEVPENSVLTLLKGTPEALITAASTTAAAVRSTGRAPLCTLAVDCVSRATFLGEAFPEELGAIAEALGPNIASTWGALTLGEIASSQTRQLELLNKTIVLGALHASQ